jgi:uncharacterized protein (DUF2235 family)
MRKHYSFWKELNTELKKDCHIYKTHKGFSAGAFEEILLETLLNYVGNRKIFKKYRKYSRFDPKYLFRWENLKDFDTKDSSSVIAENLCEFCQCDNAFVIHYSILFRSYSIFS